jgi:hypothetical protein
MSAAAFALLLFGCSDDGTVCERLAGATPTYETRADCLDAQPGLLQSDRALRSDYPSVFTQCLTQRQIVRLGTGTVDLVAFNRRNTRNALFAR